VSSGPPNVPEASLHAVNPEAAMAIAIITILLYGKALLKLSPTNSAKTFHCLANNSPLPPKNAIAVTL
jgi:hypothetical protein